MLGDRGVVFGAEHGVRIGARGASGRRRPTQFPGDERMIERIRAATAGASERSVASTMSAIGQMLKSEPVATSRTIVLGDGTDHQGRSGAVRRQSSSKPRKISIGLGRAVGFAADEVRFGRVRGGSGRGSRRRRTASAIVRSDGIDS
jgi:hypothetical protein